MMTEHSNNPLPSAQDQPEDFEEDFVGPGQEPRKAKGASLFERASGQFDLDPFRPAAPKLASADLAKSRFAIKRAKPKPPVSAPAVTPPQSAPETPATAPPVIQPLVEVPVEETGQPIRFPSQTHHVDHDHLAEHGLIVPGSEASALLEEFRIAKRQLLSTSRALGTEQSRLVLISSPLPEEGKTFCSVNLAIAMAAERNVEVLLVDGDVAKPSVCKVLGLEAGRGLMDALADPEIMVEDLVLRTDIAGLFVLPAGDAGTDSTDYLASDRLKHLLDRLTEHAANRMIIIDSPPALAASPAAEFAKHVGQTVLVARADRTGRSALEDAYRLLSACSDIKLLLNGADFSPSGRRFGSYHSGEH